MNAGALFARVSVVVAVCAAGAPARAQDEDAAREAGEHFNRGTEFFNEGRYDAALAEFQRAYRIAPAHQVLYNLGRVHEALGHAVEAADTYEQYLREAGDGISEARRREVAQALERQRARIGRLLVRTNVDGATISVDGVDVATTPLDAPLRLSAGEHTVGARAAGYDSLRRAVQLAGGVTETLDMELHPLIDQRGTLRIVATVPDVEVRLDDRLLGRTPLSSTVPVDAGRHVVVGRRAGYVEARVPVDVEHGAETEVRLDMRLDEDAPANAMGQIRIHLPDAPVVVRIDGEQVLLDGGGITLPAGPHRIEIEVAEREPWEGEVHLPPESGEDLTPPLLWTPDARAERVAVASSTRTWGQVVTLTGGLVLLGGGGSFLWNESEISATDEEVVRFNQQFSENNCDMTSSAICDDLEREYGELQADQDRQNTIRLVSGIVAAAGAAITLVGVVLWTSTPTEDDIDAAARAARDGLRLRAGLGSLSLEGRF